jgi:hypothetical protein
MASGDEKNIKDYYEIKEFMREKLTHDKTEDISNEEMSNFRYFISLYRRKNRCSS